jgi:hypothetical protein
MHQRNSNSMCVVQVPIMLKSLLCSIKESSDRELMEVGECPYDQVGYPPEGALR